MLEKKHLRYLLKKHRARWIVAMFGVKEINLRALKELVDKEGRDEDREFVNQLLNSNNLNNKKININEVRG